MNGRRPSRRESLKTLSAFTAAAWAITRPLYGAQSARPHITAVAYSPDGQTVVAGSQAGLQLIRSGTSAPFQTLDARMDVVHDIRFSPDGQWMAVAGGAPSQYGLVSWFRWPELEFDRQVEVHDDVIQSIAFSVDGSTWATASADEVCSVFAVGESKPRSRFTKHSRAVLSVVILPDGKTAVSGSRDETLRVWSLETGESIRTLHNHSRDVTALALKPSDKGLPVVASASADLTVRFWQPTIGRMVRFARLPATPLAICWVIAGKYLAAACDDGALYLIDPIQVSVRETLPVSGDWLYAVAEDPTQPGRVVAGGSYGELATRSFSP